MCCFPFGYQKWIERKVRIWTGDNKMPTCNNDNSYDNDNLWGPGKTWHHQSLNVNEIIASTAQQCTSRHSSFVFLCSPVYCLRRLVSKAEAKCSAAVLTCSKRIALVSAIRKRNRLSNIDKTFPSGVPPAPLWFAIEMVCITTIRQRQMCVSGSVAGSDNNFL